MLRLFQLQSHIPEIFTNSFNSFFFINNTKGSRTSPNTEMKYLLSAGFQDPLFILPQWKQTEVNLVFKRNRRCRGYKVKLLENHDQNKNQYGTACYQDHSPVPAHELTARAMDCSGDQKWCCLLGFTFHFWNISLLTFDKIEQMGAVPCTLPCLCLLLLLLSHNITDKI